jgi:hypothetical protein
MARGQPEGRAALGITVKSGWASAVALTVPVSAPRVIDSRRIDLSDPAVPTSRQPYHAGFGTARAAGPELSRLVASVEEFGARSVTEAIRSYGAAGHPLCGVGVVVGSLIDPQGIANEHIRIHALEGRLFRGVVENAAAKSRLACSIWRERDLHALGAKVLEQSESELRAALTTLGRAVDGSWRAEQKAAALAAWLVLAGGGPQSSKG